MRRVTTDVLHYTERTNGKFRDLRQVEVKLPKLRFARLSLNGQYRTSKSSKNATRYGNPGWTFGTEWNHINWVHFNRHCWHLSFNAQKRGITLSYGRRLF
jgi:hypothetical protein